MLLKINFTDDTPVYRQIRDQMVAGIAAGQLAPGEKLPTVRSLAEEAGINVMTVSKAYQLLKSEGYITTGRRDGAVVRLPEGGAAPETVQGLRMRLYELRLAGLDREKILELCGKLLDGEEENA